MRPPKINLEETQPGSSGARRTFWDTILTATPVVLTVLATILAGLSSRELTLSQYHRSLAAQYQSKAGDQWNYFQAKRNRRTSHENTTDLLHARSKSGVVDPAALEAHVEFLLLRLQQAQKEVNRLLELIGRAKGELGSGGAALQQAASRLQRTTANEALQAETMRTRLKDVLAKKEVQSAFAHLNGNERPRVETGQSEDAKIREAKQAIQARRSENETASLFRQIPEDDLQKAIELAEANALAVEQAYEPISAALGQIDQVVQEQVSLVRPFQRAVRELDTAATDLPEQASKPLTDLRATVAALVRSGAAVKSATDELYTDFKLAWHNYTARRYKDEADYNRRAAEVYEVQVRKSSALSERHRERSKNFFFGMLAAQAGVTIATFSLAVKHKSFLWSLASLTGLGAILFGIYVHLFM